MPTRVYIVEDHAVMRETVRDYLCLDPGIELCGEAGDAESASAALESADPDVVVLDLSLPGRSGLELLQEIRERWGTPWVVLSGHGERGSEGKAFAAGARGYVLKGSPGDVKVAIRRVVDGEIHLSERLREKLDYEPATEYSAGAGGG